MAFRTIDRRLVAAIVPLLLLACPTPARAQDLLLIPYLGFTFGGGSALFADLERGGTESASAVGGSVALLGQGIFGVEADLGYVPGFFERGDAQIVSAGSFVTNLVGSVMVTLPLAITRESLRPYVVGGGGVLWAEARDVLTTFPIKSTMPVVNFGGGAIGFLSNTVGVRFDLRYLRSLGAGDDQIAGLGPRVRFWRGSVGLVLKY